MPFSQFNKPLKPKISIPESVFFFVCVCSNISKQMNTYIIIIIICNMHSMYLFKFSFRSQCKWPFYPSHSFRLRWPLNKNCSNISNKIHSVAPNPMSWWQYNGKEKEKSSKTHIQTQNTQNPVSRALFVSIRNINKMKLALFP